VTATELVRAGRGRVAPGPRGAPLVGTLRQFRADPLGFLLQVARRHGPVARLPVGWFVVHLVSGPDGIKHVLQDHHDNFARRTPPHAVLRATLGNGLATSEGDFWRRQRRLVQPAFHRARLQGFAAIMADAARALADRWVGLAAAGEPVDLAPELSRLGLQMLGRCLFQLDLDQEARTVGAALLTVLHHTIDTVNAFLPIPAAIPTPANLRFRAAVRELDRVVQDMIDERRREGGDRPDLLTMLIQARDQDTGEGMTDRQLRDEVLTLTLAGHETTANALSWTLALLSRHPDVRRRLEREVDDALGGRPPEIDDLPRLPYVRMVLEESMRLYPPAWNVPRSVVADDTIGGYQIPAGSLVVLSPWVTHRDPALWANPEGFDPERFAPGADERRPRYAYFPFGGGPHLCLGASFANLEAQIVLATLAQRVRADLVPGHALAPEPLVTVRPRGGVPALLSAR
jgi:cytochrome P450